MTDRELGFLPLENEWIRHFTSSHRLRQPLILGHEDKLSAMRCLYCGVERALLKKLAGSENFCSDAHRLAYQEEFSRLALNRLLQAHPKPAKKPPFTDTAKTAETEAEQRIQVVTAIAGFVARPQTVLPPDPEEAVSGPSWLT